MNRTGNRPASTPRTIRLWRWLFAWGTAALLLVGAWMVVDRTPTFDDETAPFDVVAPLGEWGSGRNIAARVVDATFSDEVETYGSRSPGNWLIVNIEAATVTSPALLHGTTLVVDGFTYEPSERTASIYGQELDAGIPTAGPIAFELRPGLTSGHAHLRLFLDFDPALDSVIVIPIDLATLPRAESTTLQPVRWSNP